MDLSEYPLLNRPALMLLVLRTAAAQPATMRDCRIRLAEELNRIHEKPDVSESAIAAELDEVSKHLEAAGLLARSHGESFSLTARGRQVLRDHPLGVDETVLASFGEYRKFIAAFARHKTIDDPRPARYDEGYAAQQEGRSLSENPYPADSVDHLAWENGWSEARDTDTERRR
jgi:ribosome modulation factor